MDRDLKVVISQLRLENTELKHRIRLLQSRTNKPSGDAAETNQMSQAYPKLKREFDAVKRQLSEVSSAYIALKKTVKERTAVPIKGYEGDARFRRDLIDLQRQAKESRLKSAAFDPYAQSTLYRRPIGSAPTGGRFVGRSAVAAGTAAFRRGYSDDEAYTYPASRRGGAADAQRSPYLQAGTRVESPLQRFDSAAPRRGLDVRPVPRENRAWSPGGGGPRREVASRSPRRSESGYASASSQSSQGSRGSKASRGSAGSKAGEERSEPIGGKRPIRRRASLEAHPIVVPRRRPDAPRPAEGSPQTSRRTPKGMSYSELKQQARGSPEHRQTGGTSQAKGRSDSLPTNAHMGEASRGNVSGLSRSVESVESAKSVGSSKERKDDVSEIDKRILALREYLDNARSGILDEK